MTPSAADLTMLRDLAEGMAEFYSVNAPKLVSGEDEVALVAALLEQLEVGLSAGLDPPQLGGYVGSVIFGFEEERGLPPGPKGFVVSKTGEVEGVEGGQSRTGF